MRTWYRPIGLPTSTSASTFPPRSRGLPGPAVPVDYRRRFILSCAFVPLQSVSSFARPSRPRAGHLPWGSVPLRGISRWSPHPQASHGPLRSAPGVSHALDGFLLLRPSWVCFTPQPRPGFALQGFSLSRSRTGSSPAVALLPVDPCSLPVLPPAPGSRPPPAGLCSARESVATHGCLSRDPPDPLLSFSSFGSCSARRGDVFGRRLLHPRPFSVLGVSPTRSLPWSCDPCSPVRGFRPSLPTGEIVGRQPAPGRRPSGTRRKSLMAAPVKA
jgi:hypothetical protein